MNASTLEEQRGTVRALQLLVTEFAHLPAADLRVSQIWTDRVMVTLHDSFASFEAWREALGIEESAVDHNVLPGCVSLRAEGEFAGVAVDLTGFGPLLVAACEAVAS